MTQRDRRKNRPGDTFVPWDQKRGLGWNKTTEHMKCLFCNFNWSIAIHFLTLSYKHQILTSKSILGERNTIKNFPPKRNNDAHSSKHGRSSKTKGKKKAHTEIKSNKNHILGVSAFHSLRCAVSSSFGWLSKNNTLAHQNIHFPLFLN